ncbi:MAG: hypothetical protein N2578_08185, partial [Bdellovibrionaceae bacterium]|nr:hypothetical protein [Pseudobdellovibrionaceae bacterium]
VCSVQTYGQKLLFDFVKYPRSMQEPLIVTCSRSSLDDLRRNSTIHPDLATAVAPFEVQTDSLPCSDWGLREALELLLVKEPSSPI